jgi:cytochrome c1
LDAAVLGSATVWAAGTDVERGREVIEHAGCANCHAIPGVRSAAGAARVGPPLTDFGRRVYVAGLLPNTPEALARWIFDPQSVNPGTAMPRVGLTEAQARAAAAYLSSLR